MNDNDDDDTRIHEQKKLFVGLGLLCGKPNSRCIILVNGKGSVGMHIGT